MVPFYGAGRLTGVIAGVNETGSGAILVGPTSDRIQTLDREENPYLKALGVNDQARGVMDVGATET